MESEDNNHDHNILHVTKCRNYRIAKQLERKGWIILCVDMDGRYNLRRRTREGWGI
jgi:hypothetical protein